MSSKAWLVIVILLAVIIFALAWFLFATPAQAPAIPPAQTTSAPQDVSATATSTATSTEPLDMFVTVLTPVANESVPHLFEVTGTAPNAWFFEAVFPIQVRDPEDDLIGSSQAQAQGNWTQNGLVTFASQITVDESYEGQANLILLRDNPSGLPQNIDSVTIPITIK